MYFYMNKFVSRVVSKRFSSEVERYSAWTFSNIWYDEERFVTNKCTRECLDFNKSPFGQNYYLNHYL